jgi:hypothetical protein
VTHPDAIVLFDSSDMILNIHSDAIPIIGKCPQQSVGAFFHEVETRPNSPHQVEWCVFHLCMILRFVIASAMKAELDAFFLNCKQATIF